MFKIQVREPGDSVTNILCVSIIDKQSLVYIDKQYRPVVLNWFGLGTHVFPWSSSHEPLFIYTVYILAQFSQRFFKEPSLSYLFII